MNFVNEYRSHIFTAFFFCVSDLVRVESLKGMSLLLYIDGPASVKAQ